MKTIDVTLLAEKQKADTIDLIDVRTSVEFRSVHAQGAKNVPLDSLDSKQIAEFCCDRSGQPLYVICRSGARGAKAVQKLVDAGIEDAVNVTGGTLAWEQAGLPVNRGQKSISLERQTRIVAGALTFAGAIAGFFNHFFFVIPAFLGAGLMYSGITDTCGIGMLLAKMPWNQCREESNQ